MGATTSVQTVITGWVGHLLNQAGVLGETPERYAALRSLCAVVIAREALEENAALAGMGREFQADLEANLDRLLSDAAFVAFGCSALTDRALTVNFGLDVTAADFQEWQANRPRS